MSNEHRDEYFCFFVFTDFSKPISIGFYIEDEEHFSDQSLHPHEQ
jgi:hypothetical protein